MTKKNSEHIAPSVRTCRGSIYPPASPEPRAGGQVETLAQTWLAKHANIDFDCEILQRPHYDPTMSRQGGPQ